MQRRSSEQQSLKAQGGEDGERHQVNDVVQTQQLVDTLPRRDEADQAGADARIHTRYRLRDNFVQNRVGLRGLLAALRQQSMKSSSQ